jgi:hypothetical protein
LPRSFSIAETLLRQTLVRAIALGRFELLELFDALAHGLEIGQHPAQPPLVDVEHPAALGLLFDRLLGLPLGADEQNRPAVGHRVADECVGVGEPLDRFLQIDDVDAVALPEDVLLHLRIPAPRLVSEMDPRFQQFLHADGGHTRSLVAGCLRPRHRAVEPGRARHLDAARRACVISRSQGSAQAGPRPEAPVLP